MGSPSNVPSQYRAKWIKEKCFDCGFYLRKDNSWSFKRCYEYCVKIPSSQENKYGRKKEKTNE